MARKLRGAPQERRVAGFSARRAALSLLLAAAAYSLDLPISGQAHAILAITVLSGALWFSEAMPLHVTALLSTLLLIVLASVSPGAAFAPYFNPTIVLFFGGFMLARAMQKHGLDRQLATRFISRFGSGPRGFLLGAMIITAFLSMWVSNTAAAAMMLPIALFAVSGSRLRPGKSNYGRAVVLGIAFAATIGGIATVVGTPPNGITVAELSAHGISVNFAEWLYYGLPFAAILLPIAWLILTSVYPPEIQEVSVPKESGGWTLEHGKVLLAASVAVVLWITSFLHGIPDSAVAILAVVLLYLLGLLETADLSKIDWATLLLFGGGLSLGAAMDSSGLFDFMGEALGAAISGYSGYAVFLFVISLTVLMTLSASNTATAALIVPLAASLAEATGMGIKELAIMAGIATSIDFIVPVGTPPSAVAYSTGYISVGDMARAGILITIAGALLLATLAWLYW